MIKVLFFFGGGGNWLTSWAWLFPTTGVNILGWHWSGRALLLEKQTTGNECWRVPTGSFRPSEDWEIICTICCGWFVLMIRRWMGTDVRTHVYRDLVWAGEVVVLGLEVEALMNVCARCHLYFTASLPLQCHSWVFFPFLFYFKIVCLICFSVYCSFLCGCSLIYK